MQYRDVHLELLPSQILFNGKMCEKMKSAVLLSTDVWLPAKVTESGLNMVEVNGACKHGRFEV